MLRNIFFIISFFAANVVAAQSDTIRLATYNLLHYGRPQANRYTLKNANLQPILARIKPSIACFNEIDTTLPGILDTLNTVMPYAMMHGAVHNTTQTDILDGLFWKSGKFKILRDTVIVSYLRDIVAYDLYYDDPLLSTIHDTVKVKVITAHLKSSNAVSDRVTRDTETRRVVRYLNSLTDTLNLVMLGDFNLYKSSEAAYQNLTANTNILARLNDPANMPGNWDGTASLASIHTQSPRLVQLSDEGASGGLDSRFDFLLVSDAMMNGWKGITYIPGSYTAFGNDGLHFNKALTDAPAHPTLPTTIIQALYNTSDHLPVFADFIISPKVHNAPNEIYNVRISLQDVQIANPFGDEILYHIPKDIKNISYSLLSAQGALIQSGYLDTYARTLPITTCIVPGLYFLLLRDVDGRSSVRRLLHK